MPLRSSPLSLSFSFFLSFSFLFLFSSAPPGFGCRPGLAPVAHICRCRSRSRCRRRRRHHPRTNFRMSSPACSQVPGNCRRGSMCRCDGVTPIVPARVVHPYSQRLSLSMCCSSSSSRSRRRRRRSRSRSNSHGSHRRISHLCMPLRPQAPRLRFTSRNGRRKMSGLSIDQRYVDSTSTSARL